MPSPNRAALGNLLFEGVLQITISPSQVGANTSVEQTFTVPGLLPGDFVEINKPTAQAGLGIGNSRVSAPNTLAVVFINASGSPVTPTAGETYLLSVERPENVVNGLPTLTSVA